MRPFRHALLMASLLYGGSGCLHEAEVEPAAAVAQEPIQQITYVNMVVVNPAPATSHAVADPSPAPVVEETPRRPRSISLGFTGDGKLSGGVGRDDPMPPPQPNYRSKQYWNQYINAPTWDSDNPKFPVAPTGYGRCCRGCY